MHLYLFSCFETIIINTKQVVMSCILLIETEQLRKTIWDLVRFNSYNNSRFVLQSNYTLQLCLLKINKNNFCYNKNNLLQCDVIACQLLYLELLIGFFEELHLFGVLLFLDFPSLSFPSLNGLAFSLLLIHQPLQILLLALQLQSLSVRFKSFTSLTWTCQLLIYR